MDLNPLYPSLPPSSRRDTVRCRDTEATHPGEVKKVHGEKQNAEEKAEEVRAEDGFEGRLGRKRDTTKTEDGARHL